MIRLHLLKLFLFIFFLFFIGTCSRKHDYNPHVRFTDSIFILEKENYRAGDTVYIIGSENSEAYMPDTVYFQITSRNGDRELICSPPDTLVASVTLIKTHIGWIATILDSSPVLENGSLEILHSEDLIRVYYTVGGETAEDIAKIIP